MGYDSKYGTVYKLSDSDRGVTASLDEAGCEEIGAHDEPLFVIRAQDKLGLSVLDHYIHLYCVLADPVDRNFLDILETTRAEFLNWQRKNLDRVKIPD